VHELGITRNIVTICGERAGGRRVSRVKLEIGRLSAVVPDAIRFCFDVVSQGSPVEGARLEIVEVAGLGRCRRCNASVELSTPSCRCPACQSLELELVAGDELTIKEMETV
jgi:hydrogenase nickel incorporation protein HypA/HybF